MIETTKAQSSSQNMPLADAPCFIERQFPIAKVSVESYRERTAKQSQTLTGLGKWWGRKPLILVRAALLGLLMPASNNPEKDREIYLKLLTMDKEGLQSRKSKAIPQERMMVELQKMPPSIQNRFLTRSKSTSLLDLDRTEKEELQQLVFLRLPYSEKMEYCDRPEEIAGPSAQAWLEINTYLDTHATDLASLVQELGQLRFGHIPRVGDAFCGGGSIPFEAARLGCDSYGSDLNPVAAFLTWASLNLVGGGEEAADRVEKARRLVYDEVAKQVTEWGIETNSLGWRADSFLYCVEVTDPETGWKIPLLPSLIIGKKTKTVARLVPDPEHKRFEITIHQGVSEQEMSEAAEGGTIRNSRVFLPGSDYSTPIEIIRRNLRLWEKSDYKPRPSDVFQERLYCIRWLEFVEGKNGKQSAIKHYRDPNAEDRKREEDVLRLLYERFDDWQIKGHVPSRRIEPGYNTSQPIRERGWTYWHQLFTPRQLLVLGLFSEKLELVKNDPIGLAGALLSLGKCANWFSKLCVWNVDAANEKTEQAFNNQSLNTLSNYGSRSIYNLDTSWFGDITNSTVTGKYKILPKDARNIQAQNDIWITDPPYADAVNYEEISEFFLAWYDCWLQNLFPDWYTDSKRSLAVKGNDKNFRQSMVDCYRQMTRNMPDNGFQLVMFTHQDASVWADLTMILWAAGLRVTSAWTIATEIDRTFRTGNYVQGTVLLVLRKRIDSKPVFLDEISHKVEDEVRRQLDEMTRMEDDSDPNFGDSDYQLAAYAAALRVLTGQPIEEIDPEKEILLERKIGEVGPVEALIRRAVKIACDHLIPKGLGADLWKSLGPMERFYIKGLEVESHGEYRNGAYQELARGFGATAYTDLLESTKANETRLKSSAEFGKKTLGTFGSAGESFADSLVRQCLFAVWLTEKNEATREGLDYLHTELREAYWSNREKITGVLEYLAALRHSGSMEHWQQDAQGAALLAGAVRNDHV